MRAGLRSLLFVPGDDEHKLNRSLDSEADCLILDLEDAVRPERKDAARELVLEFIRSTESRSLIVRVNAAGSPWFADDITALTAESVPIMLPKASSTTIAAVPADLEVVGLVETASGVEEATAVVGAGCVRRLMLGSADLAAELGIALSQAETELAYPRAKLAIASAAGSIEAPIDVVHLAVHDIDGLRASAARGKALGFTAKACVHPRQVPIVNDVFTPSDDEIRRARRVLEAFEAAKGDARGVTALDGRLVDLPVVRQAQRTLASAR